MQPTDRAPAPPQIKANQGLILPWMQPLETRVKISIVSHLHYGWGFVISRELYFLTGRAVRLARDEIFAVNFLRVLQFLGDQAGRMTYEPQTRTDVLAERRGWLYYWLDKNRDDASFERWNDLWWSCEVGWMMTWKFIERKKIGKIGLSLGFWAWKLFDGSRVSINRAGKQFSECNSFYVS